MKYIVSIFNSLKFNFLNNKKENSVIFKLGLAFLFINIVKAIFVYWPQEPIYILEIFWFCNTASFLISFYILFANNQKLKEMSSLLLIMAIPMQAPWIIGFILSFFDIYYMGRMISVNDLLNYEGFYYKMIYLLSLFEHIFLIPLLFFVVYKKGFDNKSYKLMFTLFFSICAFSFFIAPDNINLHCMKYSCDTIIKYSDIVYTWDYFWFFGQMLMWFMALIISFFVLNKFFKNKHE